MTEVEWLNSDRVLTPLMNWLRRRGSQRRFFLAAAAWARQVEHQLTSERYRNLIALAEHSADQEIPSGEMVRKARAAKSYLNERLQALHRDFGLSVTAASKRLSADAAAIQAALSPVGWTAAINALKAARGAGTRSQRGVQQMALLRDLFGNPFRPLAFDPRWRTSTVVAIAKSMYESRDFSPMPILADALQDAGCEHADILDHCRGTGPHVRGCWVVDLVLGKS